MSANKEGAELALAVARVMGKDHMRLERLTRRDDMPMTCIHGAASEWRPDLGGAAGAEVLDWIEAHAQLCVGFVPLEDGHGQQECELSADNHSVAASGVGGTRWLALCRAVVAWGEQR